MVSKLCKELSQHNLKSNDILKMGEDRHVLGGVERGK